MFMVQLIFPMVALGFVTNIFQRGAASMGRMNYILDAQPSISDAAARPTGVAAEDSRAEIEMRAPVRVDLSYSAKCCQR